MLRINNSRKIHQNKSNLKRTPSEVVIRILWINEILKIALCSTSVLLCIPLDAILQEDYTVHKTESLKCGIVIFNNANTFTDTLQSVLTVVNGLVADLVLKIWIAHSCIFQKRRVNPLLIRLGQCVKFTYGFCLLRFY